MSQLVKQKTWWPTRKLMAMIISGAILGVIQSLLRSFWPDNPLMEYFPDIDIWLQGAIMIAFGYVTRNKEDVDTIQSESVVEQVDTPVVGVVEQCSCPSKLGPKKEATRSKRGGSKDN